MQGIESLDNFKSFVSSLGGLGRYEDTYIVHAAEGETVVPMEVLDRNPALKKRLFQSMMDMGIEPGRYIVGNELNSRNPVTGQPEFFLKKVFDRVKKAAADISGYAAPLVGALYGPAAGALTGGILGSFKRENPGDPTQGLQMALLGGGSGVASNLLGGAKGMDLLTGRGLSGSGQFATGLEGFKEMLSSPFTKGGREKLSDFAKLFDVVDTVEGGSKLKETAELLNIDTEDKAKMKLLEQLIDEKKKGRFGNLSLSQIASLFGLGTAGLGFLIDQTTDKGPVGAPIDPVTGEVITSILNPIGVSPSLPTRAEGGVMDLRQGGESEGPGTGTSDDIPAMLSDGEFVMTAKAVRGAGGGTSQRC